ncbi:uncharacterized protein LOC130049641 [Ostrea edulis]|uniref:uncharacterized protein LOC130049641 n=1 Tax=Ostrea edulis TaxID=37623 RepID=UPI0024AFF59D|nr:uncharacterized protein LOC130049641 [Ostrea edulis]
MAKWLSEMAERGFGLKPGEFLDFVESVVKRENRKTPFKNNRPSYDWYYKFLSRNSHLIKSRKETPLETCRAKLSKEKTDKWYSKFKSFLIEKELVDKPGQIWNADETGFSVGSVAGKVIGPAKKGQVPHLSGGHSKQRFTVMFCGAADGRMIPPFIVFPEPKPKGYNPLSAGLEGGAAAYTKKGWMDSVTFKVFLEHFNTFAGSERPIVLLFDSVSSHIDMKTFEFAKQKGIELYRLLPNATHVMQPLDVGVFGPLKTRWHQVVRKHTRENPGTPIGKDNFAEKLKEAFLLFYKPLTVINSFRSSGIYPVDGNIITVDQLKSGLTFESMLTDDSSPTTSGGTSSTQEQISGTKDINEEEKMKIAFEAFQSVLTTPVRDKYEERLREGYDVEGKSPGFDAYRKLHKKSRPSASKIRDLQSNMEVPSGLDLLASVAAVSDNQILNTEECSTSTSESTSISPVLKGMLTFPHADESKKRKRISIQSTLPDNLTSPESLRLMALKDLEKIRAFAEKERKAKVIFMKKLLPIGSSKASNQRKQRTSQVTSKS